MDFQEIKKKVQEGLKVQEIKQGLQNALNLMERRIILFGFLLLFILYLWSGGVYEYQAATGYILKINKVTGSAVVLVPKALQNPKE